MSHVPYAHPDFDGHREVAFFHDPGSGLSAMIAVHRLWRAPAAGGCRVRRYTGEGEALADLLRLSRGMSYKAVMAGVDHGGAKMVVPGPLPEGNKRRDALLRLADWVNSFAGAFRTGVDFGLRPEDVAVMREATPYVVGLGRHDPASMTARGAHAAIVVAVRHRLDRDSLAGIRVAVQGLGKVGRHLVELLLADGAVVLGAEIDPAGCRTAEELGVRLVSPEDIHRVEADVFAPCAIGGVLNCATIPEIRAPIVAGAANNQLATGADGEALHARGILYAPDYIANAGGLIAVAAELAGEDSRWARRKLATLDRTLAQVFAAAAHEDIPPPLAADRIAAERIRTRDAHMPGGAMPRMASGS